MTTNPYANPEHEALSGENGDDYGCDNNNNTTNDDDKEQVKSSNQKARLNQKIRKQVRQFKMSNRLFTTIFTSRV